MEAMGEVNPGTAQTGVGGGAVDSLKSWASSPAPGVEKEPKLTMTAGHAAPAEESASLMDTTGESDAALPADSVDAQAHASNSAPDKPVAPSPPLVAGAQLATHATAQDKPVALPATPDAAAEKPA